MRKSLILGGVLVIALALTTGVMACDGSKAKTASAEDGYCSKSAASAAYAKAYAESGCSKTASKAAYDEVYAKTGCDKTAEAAAGSSFSSTGCMYFSCDGSYR